MDENSDEGGEKGSSCPRLLYSDALMQKINRAGRRSKSPECIHHIAPWFYLQVSAIGAPEERRQPRYPQTVKSFFKKE